MKKLTIIIFLILAVFCCVTDAGGQTLTDTLVVKSEQEFSIEFKHYLPDGSDSLAFSAFSGNAAWPENGGFSLIYKVGETTFAAPFNAWFSAINESETNLQQHRINFASAGALPYVATQDSALVTLNFIAPTVFETVELPTLAFFSVDEDPFLYSNTVVVIVEPTSGVNNEDPLYVLPKALEVDLYPNPNPEKFVVKQTEPGYVTAKVYDAHGKLVKTLANDSYMHNTKHLSLYSLNDLKSGVYFMQVSNNTTKLTKTFTVLR